MLKFFNRLTKQKQNFVPTHDGVVTMYSCGPTVYSYQHIGNMRAYVFMDLIRRVLRYNGYKVNGAMNITDVGHLTSDEDAGEDKMLVASVKEQKTPFEIAEFYSKLFFDDLTKLNVGFPEHICKATEHVEDMVKYVERLVEIGYAYETSKGIYFDVQKFENYGMLSGIKIEDRLAGARIEIDNEKKHPADFALWIKAPKEHIMQWQSPWGMGYPGWHIECSVMGQKYLGTDIDIHTGGIDHVTVHHENEIAQNDSLAGHRVVKFWLELEFLQIDGGKMSKSLGNIYTIKNLEDKGFSASDYRYFLLSAHYLKMQNFTFEALGASKNALANLIKKAKQHTCGSKEKIDLSTFDEKFLNAINDDLNLPLALGVVWDMLKLDDNENIYNMLLKFDKVLGLEIEKQVLHFSQKDDVPEEIKLLAVQRWQAKINKDFVLSDSLRQEILSKGYLIKDEKDKYTISKQ